MAKLMQDDTSCFLVAYIRSQPTEVHRRLIFRNVLCGRSDDRPGATVFKANPDVGVGRRLPAELKICKIGNPLDGETTDQSLLRIGSVQKRDRDRVSWLPFTVSYEGSLRRTCGRGGCRKPCETPLVCIIHCFVPRVVRECPKRVCSDILKDTATPDGSSSRRPRICRRPASCFQKRQACFAARTCAAECITMTSFESDVLVATV